jgi:hypothetical protein
MDERRSWIQRFWWLDLSLYWHWQPEQYRWSPEEVWTRGTIWTIAVGLFVLPYFGVYAITTALGVDGRIGALFALFAALPPALGFARVIAVRLWPETVRKADENAAERWSPR